MGKQSPRRYSSTLLSNPAVIDDLYKVKATGAACVGERALDRGSEPTGNWQIDDESNVGGQVSQFKIMPSLR